jgi:hypothetical protein
MYLMQALSEDIGALMDLLPLTLDLSLVLDGVRDGTKYRLRCIMCLYGKLFTTE